MYCKHCGKEVDDKAVVCIHCGCALDNWQIPPMPENPEYMEPKTGIGVLLSLLLGCIGLLIGICLYPSQTIARKTFIKGWLTTFIVEVIVLAVIFSIYFFTFFMMIASWGVC